MSKLVTTALAVLMAGTATAAPPPPLVSTHSTRFRSEVETCIARRLAWFGTPAILRLDADSRIQYGGPTPYLWFDIRENGMTRLIEARAAGPMYDRFVADVQPCL